MCSEALVPDGFGIRRKAETVPGGCTDLTYETRVSIHEPISLPKIADSGQCFRWTAAGDGFHIPYGKKDLYIRQPDLFTLEMSCTEEEYENVWREYFDLDTDYGALCARVLEGTDPFLYEAVRCQRGIRILRQDPWEMLITCIMTQNRNIPAIRKSVELLSEKAGVFCESRYGGGFHAFPEPYRLSLLTEDDLLACRLGYRAKYVQLAARAVASGELDLEELSSLPDEECEKRLTAIRGIGPKVAACVMLFGLHRLDAFPIDVWVRRILENEYPGGYPMAAYSPYNGLYQQYMFAYYRERKADRTESDKSENHIAFSGRIRY